MHRAHRPTSLGCLVLLAAACGGPVERALEPAPAGGDRIAIARRASPAPARAELAATLGGSPGAGPARGDDPAVPAVIAPVAAPADQADGPRRPRLLYRRLP